MPSHKTSKEQEPKDAAANGASRHDHADHERAEPASHLHPVGNHVEPHVTPSLAAVSCRDVGVRFGNNRVISGVTFDIPQGDVIAILGPNGSGKTTLLKAILGLVPHEGEIRIFGKHLHAVRDLIAYVPQRFDFDREFPITVREFMELARHRHSPTGRILDRITEVGLTGDVLDKKLGSLSGGQMQRVLIAQALLNNPLVLFLDEPSANIDISGEATLTGILKHLRDRTDVTVVMVSHDVAMVADLVDQVLCVNGKMLCYGPPASVLTPKAIEDIFGDKRGPFAHGHAH